MFKTIRMSVKADNTKTKSEKQFTRYEDAKKYANRYSKNLGKAIYTSVEIYAGNTPVLLYKADSKFEITESVDIEEQIAAAEKSEVAFEATVKSYDKPFDDECDVKKRSFADLEEAKQWCRECEMNAAKANKKFVYGYILKYYLEEKLEENCTQEDLMKAICHATYREKVWFDSCNDSKNEVEEKTVKVNEVKKTYTVAYEATVHSFENGNEEDSMLCESRMFVDYEDAKQWCQDREMELGTYFATAYIDRYDLKEPFTKEQVLKNDFKFNSYETVWDNIDFDTYAPVKIVYSEMEAGTLATYEVEEEIFAGNLASAKEHAKNQAKQLGTNIFAEIHYENKMWSTLLQKEFSECYSGSIDNGLAKSEANVFDTFKEANEFVENHMQNISRGGYVFKGVMVDGYFKQPELIKNIKLRTLTEWQNGKFENFYDYANVGDMVDEPIIEYFTNVLPPVSWGGGLLQVGEPYSHADNPDTERFEPTFTTFERVNKNWFYRGTCFKGKTQNIA